MVWEHEDEAIEEISKKIDELEQKKKEIDKQIALLDEKKTEVLHISYIDKYDSFNLIAYLVSQIEDKKFVWKERGIGSHYRYDGEVHDIRYADYIMAYLVEEGKEEEAERELSQRFPLPPKEEKYRLYTEYLNAMQNYRYNNAATHEEKLSKPSDNYIQLTYYLKNDGNQIVYTEKNRYDNTRQLEMNPISSKLADKRYIYIIEFMGLIAKAKLVRPNFKMTLDEMYALADTFVKQYKDNKDNATKKMN